MSIAKEQQRTKPKIDDVVETILHGENLASVMELIKFIKESKISLRWASQNCWHLYFKSNRIGNIRMTDKYRKNYALPDNSWAFSPWGSDDVLETLVANNNRAKDIIWNNVRLCSNCCNCGPGSDRIVFDKMFEKTCHGWFRMLNPDKDTLEFIKMLLKEKVCQLADFVK
jgi:hypothetical protein